MSARRGKDIDHREDELHIAASDLLDRVLFDNVFHTAIETNQGSNKTMQAVAKARGVMAGFPDHMIMWAYGPVAYGNFNAFIEKPLEAQVFRILLIELKAPADPIRNKRRGQLSTVQRECHAYLRERGVDVVTCWSIEDVAAALVEHAVPHRKVEVTA